MREAIGMQGLMYIIIILLLLFTGFLCLSINFTAAFKVSDAIINQINKDQGIKLENIRKELIEAGYTNQGPCDTSDKWYAVGLNDTNLDTTKTHGNYCIKKIPVYSDTTRDELPQVYYYRIKVFYKVDVPMLSRLALNVQADTMVIYTPETGIGYTEID